MSNDFTWAGQDSFGNSRHDAPKPDSGLRQILFNNMQSMGLADASDAHLAEGRRYPDTAPAQAKSPDSTGEFRQAGLPAQQDRTAAAAAIPVDVFHQKISDLIGRQGEEILAKRQIRQAARFTPYRPVTASGASFAGLSADREKTPDNLNLAAASGRIAQASPGGGPGRRMGLTTASFHDGVAQAGNEGFHSWALQVKSTPDGEKQEAAGRLQAHAAREGFSPLTTLPGEARADEEQMDIIAAQQQGGETDRDQWQQQKDLQGPFADAWTRLNWSLSQGLLRQAGRLADPVLRELLKPDYREMVNKDERNRIEREEKARLFSGTLNGTADKITEGQGELGSEKNQAPQGKNSAVLDAALPAGNAAAEAIPGAAADAYLPPAVNRVLDGLDIISDMQAAYYRRMRELVLISDEDICREDGPNPYWQVCREIYDGRDWRKAAMQGRKRWARDEVMAAGKTSFIKKSAKKLITGLTRDGKETAATRLGQHLSLNALEKKLGEY